MKSLTKRIISIISGIGAVAGLTMFATSCSDDDDNKADEVDCTQSDNCNLPECKDNPACQPSVYGPAYTEDMLKCCGEDTSSEEFKVCIADYVKSGACDAKPDEGMDVYGPAPAP